MGLFLCVLINTYIQNKREVCSMLLITQGIADIVRVLLFFALSPLIVIGYIFLFFLAVIMAFLKPDLINKVEKKKW